MAKKKKSLHTEKSGRQALKKSRDKQFGGRQPSKLSGTEVTGKVQMSRDGYLFVIVEGEKDNDVFVKPSRTKGALNGDIVRCVVTKDSAAEPEENGGSQQKTARRRREGAVIGIVERSTKPFVGVLHTVGRQAWVLMQSKNMPYDIKVPFDSLPEGAKRGVKVSAVVDDWPKGSPNPIGHITDVLGRPGENDTEMHAILAEYGLPYRFEPEVENAADSISEEITEEDLKGRRDFREVLTFTIDPEDAKDFDDALSFRKLGDGNLEVGVHIADVSWYVRPGTLVDQEAQSRGTSVYLVDRTVPMLPEKLSNKLCSLRPNEDKLTFSAVFEMNPEGKVLGRWFGRTVIRSDYRFAYETAQQIIDNGPGSLTMELRGGTDGKSAPVEAPVGTPSANDVSAGDVPAKDSSPLSEAAMGGGVWEGCLIPRDLKEAVLTLHKLAEKMRRRRFSSGAISFDRPEMKVEVDSTGRPVRVYEKISKEANWLIEEFMLLANRSVAEYIATAGKMNGRESKSAKTFIYRVHGEPNNDKIGTLGQFAGNFGYELGPTGNSREIAKSLNKLLAAAKGTPECNAFQMIALRSMAKATYTTENIGHYGLAFRFYTHFTSPIRRYPDTMVHRLLAHYLDGGASQDRNYFEEQCLHASEREQVATNAERDSIKYKLVEFLQDKVGLEYDGCISGLTEWGMYVEIKPTMIEGMVALRDVRSDFFDFDEENYLIRGRRTGRVFRLGDQVRIRVKAANLEQRIIDYELLDDLSEGSESDEERRNPPFYASAPGRKRVSGRSSKVSKGSKSGKSSKSALPQKPSKSSRSSRSEKAPKRKSSGRPEGGE